MELPVKPSRHMFKIIIVAVFHDTKGIMNSFAGENNVGMKCKDDCMHT